MKRHHLSVLLLSAGLAACQTAPVTPVAEPLVPAAPAAPPAEPALFVLADPQLHNVFGAQLRQMLLPADWASKVAVRAPELNLLAPLVLRHTLAQRDVLGAGQAPTVLLGDATNIACSGEWDDFAAEMQHGAGLWLMAHGNHDSYLMGTTNTWVPTAASWVPDGGMADSALPLDESYFKPRAVPVNAAGSLWKKNWPDACARPAATADALGSPMNKPRWLARYAAMLEPHGLDWATNGPADKSGARITSTVRAGSPLAALNYRMQGRWYRAHPGVVEGQFDYRRAWSTYVVQAFDLGPQHTMILIDTSVCPNGRLTWGRNTGTNACVGKEQLADIDALLAQAKGRRIVMGAHFPLDDLEDDERDALVARLTAADPQGWTYLSGHTHDALTVTAYAGGVDVNIGSTTDWPMEAHVLHFDGIHAPRAVSTSLRTQVAPLRWSGPNPAQSELCRHYRVAEKLSKLDPAVAMDRWVSPSLTGDECDDLQDEWAERAQDLQQFRDTIARRFDSEPRYAQAMLRIAAGASLHEYESFQLGDLIP